MNNPTLFDPIEPTTPVLPYGGTSGWSGSDTSRERAETADTNGTTAQRQAATLQALAASETLGLTWFELAHTLGLHHGAASGILSTLHRAGHIERLTEKREKCAVYVCPRYVNNRQTAPYTPNKAVRTLIEILTELAADLDAGRYHTAQARVHATLNNLK